MVAAAPGAAARPDPPGAAVEQYDRIAAVDPGEWDRMAGGRVICGHGLLRALEESSTSGFPRLYFVTRGESGIDGAIVARLQPAAIRGELSIDSVVYGRLAGLARAAGLSALPVLVCGSTLGGGSGECIVRSDLPPAARATVRRRLLAHVERTCAEKGWSLCLRCVTPAASDAAAARHAGVDDDGRYARTSEAPAACLDVTWDSFDGYLRHLKRSHPHTAKNIRNERNRARREGVVIERWRDADVDPARLHALLDAHNRRRNDAAFAFDASLAPRLQDALGDRALIDVARVGGQVIGVTIGVRDDERAHQLFVGLDTGVRARASLLANLCYNEPIRTLTESGIRRIYYGQLLYEFKALRGCTLIDSDLLLRPRGALRRQLLRPLFRLRARVLDPRTARFPRASAEA